MTDTTTAPRRKASIIVGAAFGLLAAGWLVVGQIDEARSRENMQAFRNMGKMFHEGADSLPLEFTDITQIIQNSHASRIEAAALIKLTDKRSLLCEETGDYVHRTMRTGNFERVERLGSVITERAYLPAAAERLCDFALKVVKNPEDYT